MNSTLRYMCVAALTGWMAFAPAIAQKSDSPASSTPAKPDASRAEVLRLIDIWLDSVQVYDRIPSFSAAIVQGDEVVWSKGYGTLDKDHKVPTTAQTIYSICSISKLFTSVALMQQWEVGKVRLDEPITTYLPWAKLKPADQGKVQDSVPITLRAMLSHSAGLPRESDSLLEAIRLSLPYRGTDRGKDRHPAAPLSRLPILSVQQPRPHSGWRYRSGRLARAVREVRADSRP